VARPNGARLGLVVSDCQSCPCAGGDILGGIEFGTKVTGSKIVVVMGHTSCGAVRGAIDHVELGNLTTLLWKIQPSIPDVDASITPRTGANSAFVDKVAEANVRTMMELIKAKSPIVADQLENKEIILVGAMCDIETGKVTFLQ
jgi:carbonic anhydrase